MPKITTDHLWKQFGNPHTEWTLASLGCREVDGPACTHDTHELVWHNKTARITGIAAYEADEDARGLKGLEGECNCPKSECRHAIATLWHRAFTDEGTNKLEFLKRLEQLRQEDRERRAAEAEARQAEEAARREEARLRLIAEAEARRVREELRQQVDAAVGGLVGGKRTGPGFTYEFDFARQTVTTRYDGHPISHYDQVERAYRYSGFRAPRTYNHIRDRHDTTSDRGIDLMRALLPLLGVSRDPDARQFKGDMAKSVLDMAVSLGLACDTSGRTIVRGAPVQLRGEWRIESDGTQNFKPTNTLPRGCTIHSLGELVVYNEDAATVSHVDCGMPEKTFRGLVAVKGISPELSTHVRERLADGLPEEALPKAIVIERRKSRPKARVLLDEVDGGEGRRQQARIALEYDWGSVAPGADVQEGSRRMEDGRLVIEERDLEAERTILKVIPGAALDRSVAQDLADARAYTFETGEIGSLAFRRDVLPDLEASDDFVVERTENWSSDLVQWLDGDEDLIADDGVGGALQMSIAPGLDGLNRDILPALADMAREVAPETEHSALAEAFDLLIEHPEHPVRRTGGGVMLVPYPVLIRLLPAIWHLINAGMDDTGGMGRLAVADLSHVGSDIRLRVPARISRLLALRADVAMAKSYRIPKSFSKSEKVDKAQREGLAWMRTLHEAGYGGILADEVGVGKTLQILLHAMSLHEAGKLERQALIVVPKTSIGEWTLQAEKFFPEVRVIAWEGSDRRQHADSLHEAVIVLATPYCVVHDEHIRMRDWSLLAIDEAQDARNPATELAHALREIRADQKIPTSGTPVENHLGDAWSLMEIACSGLLGTRAEFGEHIQRPIEKGRDGSKRAQFARFLEPFVLRRTREEAGHKVPKPKEIDHRVRLLDDQALLYETIRKTAEADFASVLSKGRANWHVSVLPIITRLRQVCCSPELVKVDYARPLAKGCTSAKTVEILKTAMECKRKGRKILVFSSWTEHLELVMGQFMDVGISVDIIHGGLTTKKRQAALQKFRVDGTVDALFITTKTGGRSLNIPEADDVFIIDPWWNPQPEIQAIGRTQRRGQKKVVTVHRFIIEDSIEARIMKIQARKIAIANVIHSRDYDKDMMDSVTIDDINAILAPLGGPAPAKPRIPEMA